jgi:ATP-dependent exoDNAse (exonuclease V) beta subunit
MKKITYNAQGQKLEFDEALHKYTHDGEVLESVTQALGRLFLPFDEYRMSKRAANRRRTSQRTILREWERARDTACDFGTAVHLHAETYIRDGVRTKPANAIYEQTFKTARSVCDALLVTHDFVEAEKMVFSPKYKIAGTLDLILRNKETGKIVLVDWKTNKELTKDPTHYNKPGLGPFKEILDSKYNKYCLQLNIYRRIMEEENYFDEEIGDMIIIHLRDGTVKTFTVPDHSELIDKFMRERL